ncbi:MAG: thiolase domain-containing protein [Deltaproteobacteria bacterium]|nr:thiolase domain-containing protein [Deltaproteobacteria bacterium]
MRDVAVVSFAQTKNVRRENRRNEVEMLIPVVQEAVEKSGVPKQEIGFYCSGSSDYLAGQSFSFVMAVDCLGAWPPIAESHVEMDGAWALYEAWIKIQCGEADSALIFSFGRSSPGVIRETLVLQLDPYTLAPLGADPVSLAALQARALLESTDHSEREMAEVAARNRSNAKNNPYAQLTGDFDVDELLAEPYFVSPLRKHDCAPISDGATAIVIAADDVARKASKKPAWIRGIDHRIESHQLGLRDLAQSTSTSLAGEKAGAIDIDVAELHAPFSHQELILRDALSLGDDVKINPSGGALAANSVMVAGLTRIGEAANAIWDGTARRALGHATSGPCLQQNLVCVLEGE